MRIRQQHSWARVGQVPAELAPLMVPIELAATDFTRDAASDPRWRWANYDVTIDAPEGIAVLDMYGREIDRLPRGSVMKVWQEAVDVPGKKRIARNVNWGVPNSIVQYLPEEVYLLPGGGWHVSWAANPEGLRINRIVSGQGLLAVVDEGGLQPSGSGMGTSIGPRGSTGPTGTPEAFQPSGTGTSDGVRGVGYIQASIEAQRLRR